jgi:hypothetical protein
MTKLKNKSKGPAKSRLPKSEFATLALRAMRRAQKAAAKENARYGLPLIVQ